MVTWHLIVQKTELPQEIKTVNMQKKKKKHQGLKFWIPRMGLILPNSKNFDLIFK